MKEGIDPKERRGRKADPSTDDTPFTESTVNVEARAGFLLRQNREFGMNADIVTGTAMVNALRERGVRASHTDVSNWERGITPAPAPILEAYEVLTGAHPGSLRGIVETMRRCYQTVRVPERRDGQHARIDLEIISDRCQVVFEGTPRGIDWLHFADLLGSERILLPTFLVPAPFARLVSEMSRSVGVAYLTRYEALASLLDSPYALHMRETIREQIFDEHAQVVIDAIGALSESPDPEVLIWISSLLRHSRTEIVRGAAFALDNAVETGRVDDETLSVISAAVIQAYLDADERSRRAMGSVIRSLPSKLMSPLLARLDPAGRARILDVEGLRSTEERIPLLAIAGRVQSDVAEALGQPREQPLLTRLIYEALFEERVTRRFHATSMLRALPYRGLIADANVKLVSTHADASVRYAATEALMRLGRMKSTATLDELVRSSDVDAQRAGLIASAHGQIPLATDLLRPFVDVEHPLWSKALYAAGMTGHSLIDEIADGAGADPVLRGAARWWQCQGTAVVD